MDFSGGPSAFRPLHTVGQFVASLVGVSAQVQNDPELVRAAITVVTSKDSVERQLALLKVNSPELLRELARNEKDANSGYKTHPVAMKQANAWGLYDMHGNVWEWCLDWYTDYPADDNADSAGASSGPIRVGRGGGWGHSALLARSASRVFFAPADRRDSKVGFRLALSFSP